LRELRLLPAPAGGRCLLDVGCGDGLFFDDLAELGEVFGVESNAEIVGEHGPWRERIHRGAFDETYRPDRRFDLILMLDVLEHLTDRTSALRRARELLAPGGRVLITVPAFPLLWTRHDELNEHELRFTRASLNELAEEAGLRVDRARYFFHWLFFAKLAQRMIESVARAEPRTPGLPSPWTNELVLALCRIEARCCPRLAVPFGSSLLGIYRDSHL
jgi:SAM-dependent methyltransferase